MKWALVEVVHCLKDKMVQEPTNLLRVVEAHHNHQMVWVEELGHCSQKGVEECLSDWKVEEELHHLVVMEVIMVMVMILEEVVGHLLQGEMEEMVVMVVMTKMVVEEMICHHHLIMDSHNTIKVKGIDWVYVVQGLPRPPGQLGQDGKRWSGWTSTTDAQEE